jgi:hypothetical protein
MTEVDGFRKTSNHTPIEAFFQFAIDTYAHDPIEELEANLTLIDPSPTPDRVLDAEQRLMR